MVLSRTIGVAEVDKDGMQRVSLGAATVRSFISMERSDVSL